MQRRAFFTSLFSRSAALGAATAVAASAKEPQEKVHYLGAQEGAITVHALEPGKKHIIEFDPETIMCGSIETIAYRTDDSWPDAVFIPSRRSIQTAPPKSSLEQFARDGREIHLTFSIVEIEKAGISQSWIASYLNGLVLPDGYRFLIGHRGTSLFESRDSSGVLRSSMTAMAYKAASTSDLYLRPVFVHFVGIDRWEERDYA